LTVNSSTVWTRRVGDRKIFNPEYFERSGYEFSRTAASVSAGPKSLVLHLLAGGEKLTRAEPFMYQNSPCMAVTITGTDKVTSLVLDPALGHAARELQETDIQGRRRWLTINTQFKNLAGTQIWMPTMSETAWHTWHSTPSVIDAKPFMSTTISVSSLDNKQLDESTFALDYNEPGTRVHSSEVPGAERTSDGMLYYRVPANPSRLDDVIRQAAEEQAANRSVPLYRKILIGIIAVLIGLVAVLTYHRWWSKHQGARR
jgi:hypothetical protein